METEIFSSNSVPDTTVETHFYILDFSVYRLINLMAELQTAALLQAAIPAPRVFHSFRLREFAQLEYREIHEVFIESKPIQ